jgi:thiamine biosynthesis lipoprotein
VNDVYLHTVALMGTVVTIQVVGHGENPQQVTERAERVERAVGWFRSIEASCNRFDAESEARQLSGRIGTAVPVSPMLYEAVQFAMAVAEESGGAFDPTVGLEMEKRGFNREYRSGEIVRTGVEPAAGGAGFSPPGPSPVSYRDVVLDPGRKAVTLLRPLVLDLGAVAKGLAIDMAARELQPFENYAIDAGGDLYLAGRNPDGAPWSVGIRHPREAGEIVETLHISNAAVCTSGDYERVSPGGAAGHHILDPRTGRSATTLASVTVVAPSAMVADALATAAFVLGPTDGLRLLERSGVDGLMVSPSLERFRTRGMRSAAILPNA